MKNSTDGSIMISWVCGWNHEKQLASIIGGAVCKYLVVDYMALLKAGKKVKTGKLESRESTQKT